MARGRGRGNPDDEDAEDINKHLEETSTIGRGYLSHRATPAHPDGRYSLHYTHGWSHVTHPYPTYAPGLSLSHYTSSSPPGHPYPYQHVTPSPPVHAFPPQHGFIPSSCSSLGTCKCPLRYMMRGVGRQAIRYMGNIYLIAKKRITPIYLTEEVFEHYKRMRATYETFKKKSEQISTNRKSEVGGPGTGISLHSAGSISARQHGDTLAELTRILEEMSTQTPDASIDDDSVYLEVVPEVKGLYEPHELEELQRDHQRLQETLPKERMERQEQMRKDKMERQEETREMQDRLARIEALLMQHLGIRPHVPPTPRTPPSPLTERSGPQNDDHPGHLTTEIAHSQSAHPHDHRPGHWTDPHRRMPEDQHHLLDDHDEFMEQLMPPPRPPPRQE
ncbi:hypothetical protein Syun_004154 [Stephania yunnanensis]|uniref:Uncharacterized protein n=1 Tax=Stephania yunnanensis TaxID=152371 RepID=A0AAP0Q0H6_9MAGN